MSDPNPVKPEDADNIESQTAGIYANLILGAIITTVSLIIFEILRRKLPDIFESRRVLHDKKDPLDYQNNRIFSPASPSYRPFGWIYPVFHLDIDTLVLTHGLDTALFLRYLRTMAFVFFILLVPTVPLLPIYFTGTFNVTRNEDQDKILGVLKFSLSNVSLDDGWRMWVTLASDYIIVIFVLFILYREFKVFTKYRIQYRAGDNPSNYAILVEDIPKSSLSESSIHSYWDQIFPGRVRRVYVIKNAKKLIGKINEFWKTVNLRESAEWSYAYNSKLKGEKPSHKAGNGPSCFRKSSTKVDSIGYYTDQQQSLAATISSYQESPYDKFTPNTKAAIVIFDSKRTASIAAQTNFTSKENEWRVQRAPEPNAINWSSFSIPGYQIGIRTCITITASIALTLLWIIPITAIMALTSLSSLSKLEIGVERSTPFSFLDGLIEDYPQVNSLIESLLPSIILSVFLSLIPVFLRIFVNISRVSSNAQADMHVRDWYFNFVVFSNFLFVIVSGSLLTSIQEIAKEPSKMASFLASSAPKQGAFLMNFIILKAVSETPQQILQIGRVVVRWVMLKFIAKTKRQKDNASIGNTQFQFFRYYAISQLIALLGFIYCTISPFIIPCCLLYFVIMYIVMKYNLCFSFYNQYQDGGYMYGGALYGAWTGLFLHLITMIGIFALNKNPAQSILIILPAAIMLTYLLSVRKRFSRIGKHGSALETIKLMDSNGNSDEINDEIMDRYIHPAFVPIPDPLEILNGVDSNTTGKDFNDDLKGDNDVEKGDADQVEGPIIGTDDVSGEDVLNPKVEYKSKSKSTEDWLDASNGGNSDIAPPPKSP